jgi:hypothetical protein
LQNSRSYYANCLLRKRWYSMLTDVAIDGIYTSHYDCSNYLLFALHYL